MKPIFAILVASMMLLASGWVHADDSTIFYVNADRLNARSEPVTGAVIKTFTRGDSVHSYATRGSWVRVTTFAEDPLWVSSKYLCSTPGCSTNDTPAKTGTTSLNVAPSSYAPSRSTSYTPRTNFQGGGCPCSGPSNCYGPRGGRYCITSGGNKRYR